MPRGLGSGSQVSRVCTRMPIRLVDTSEELLHDEAREFYSPDWRPLRLQAKAKVLRVFLASFVALSCHRRALNALCSAPPAHENSALQRSVVEGPVPALPRSQSRVTSDWRQAGLPSARGSVPAYCLDPASGAGPSGGGPSTTYGSGARASAADLARAAALDAAPALRGTATE